MDKNEQNYNNRAAQEMLGNPYMTSVAGATALGCAQEIMEKDNLDYSEMTALYQQFLNSKYAAKYGLDPASLNNAQTEANKTLNGMMNKKEESTVETEWQPKTDTMPSQQSYSDTPLTQQTFYPSDSTQKF